MPKSTIIVKTAAPCLPRLSAAAIAIQALCCASAFAQGAPAPAAQPAPLQEVKVVAPRVETRHADSAAIGGFSDLPLLETPASVSVLTREQMQDLQVRQTTDAVKFDASVNDSYNAIGYAEQFSIRGFDLDNNYGFRKDGMAIPGDAPIPLENKERVEVLKGLAGLQAGVAAPGGIINYVVKRPTATPLRTVTVEASERGTLYGAVDLGGRFDDTRFGYRINVADERLRSYVKGADGSRRFASAAFDWQISPKALLQIDTDYQYRSQVTVPGFQLINGTDLPQVAADTMLNNQPWTKPVTTRDSNVGVRFEYHFDNDWRASVAANRHLFKRDDFAAFPYGCTGQLLYPGFCANGDYDVYDYQSTGERKSPVSVTAMVQGKLTTATLQHDLTFGASGFRRRDEFGDYVYEVGSETDFTSNIYHPVAVPGSSNVTGPVSLRRKEDESALFAQDIVTLSTRFKLHAGVRYDHLKREQYDADGATTSRFDGHSLLPNAALVFAPQPNVSVYGSYATGLEHGGVAPIGTTNANAVLDAAKSKQFELGVKAQIWRDALVSAALFDITKPLEATDASNTYVRRGNAHHRGLELAASGRVDAALNIGASATLIDATQRDTGDATLDGKDVVNVPHLKSTVYADYALAAVPGLKLNATWEHASGKYFNPDNSVSVPGYHVFNLGAAYVSKIGGIKTTLRANVDNVFDKFYWRDVTQQLGGYLLPGAPRIFKLSAQFDL